VEAPIEEPTLEIQVDLAAAQRFGIKPGDVRRSAATLLSGLLVGNLFEEQKVFEVVVWSTPESRDSVSAVENLLIDTPTGSFVRLSEVASVRVTPNVAQINREAVSRYLDVSADVDGRGVSDVEDEINERVRGLGFPIDYHAEVATDRASGFRESRSSVLPYIAAAAIGAFLLLQAAFSSWRLAAIAFVVLPAGLVGGVVAAVIDGGDVSLGSYLGLVAVLAISIRNGVSLVRSYQELDRSADGSFDAAAAVAGAGQRFLPVLVTTIAAALAMLPLLIAGSVPGLEVVRPMAVVVLGGLLTSALLALFLLPALFLRIWRPSEQEVAL
jgi:Cu/Ag efflux pump CusA